MPHLCDNPGGLERKARREMSTNNALNALQKTCYFVAFVIH